MASPLPTNIDASFESDVHGLKTVTAEQQNERLPWPPHTKGAILQREKQAFKRSAITAGLVDEHTDTILPRTSVRPHFHFAPIGAETAHIRKDKTAGFVWAPKHARSVCESGDWVVHAGIQRLGLPFKSIPAAGDEGDEDDEEPFFIHPGSSDEDECTSSDQEDSAGGSETDEDDEDKENAALLEGRTVRGSGSILSLRPQLKAFGRALWPSSARARVVLGDLAIFPGVRAKL
ncbi:unnamed protein product [Mycena citricolor]|nr:unnamed protein product [Mycena citricolor]